MLKVSANLRVKNAHLYQRYAEFYYYENHANEQIDGMTVVDSFHVAVSEAIEAGSE